MDQYSLSMELMRKSLHRCFTMKSVSALFKMDSGLHARGTD